MTDSEKSLRWIKSLAHEYAEMLGFLYGIFRFIVSKNFKMVAAMALTVFSTLGMRKVTFVPVHKDEVRMYVCGPTVYNYVHIGNARAFIVADVIRRYLEYNGFLVKFVSNITDVDDKTIKQSKEKKLSLQQIGELYSNAYFEALAALNVKKADVNPRATQHISEIIEAIQALIQNGYAYEIDSDVYFAIDKFEGYGKLSGNKSEALELGARIEVNPEKRNPADFALWKKQKKGEPAWLSPWGMGRPGWHIECSVMAMKYLGETIDIHMGGKDLIFPHHENEIAQAESLTSKTFAKYWLHNEWLSIEGKKMSKSLGNFITVQDALKICKPQVLRFFLISAHYRSPMDFNKENLNLAETNLEKLTNTIVRFNNLKENNSKSDEEATMLSEVLEAKKKFETAMNDDFNTPLAISAIFDIAKAMNNYADKNEEIEVSIRQEVAETFTTLLDVLGIKLETEIKEEGKAEDLDNMMSVLVELRNEMRRRNDWKTSDKIRDELQKIGIILEDTTEGTKWKKKN